MFDRDCLNKEPSCRIPYSGQQDGLHILSSHTAAGEELAWEFINIVTNSQISLTAFCSVVNSRYYFSTIPFMSRQTFTDWIFSWLANFRIDFRQTCDTCQANPKILACDGTKLGMYFKNVSLKAFETPTSECVVTPPHKRTMRQFFSYSDNDTDQKKINCRQAQDDLLFCSKEL